MCIKTSRGSCPEFRSETFRDTYYLKEELVGFCRENRLQTSGGKTELIERIAVYLETGERSTTKIIRRKVRTDALSISSVIEENVVCSEKHRAFFKEFIGPEFRFNVPFVEWLRSNAGRTYAEAIEEYHRICNERKNGRTTIGKQFEYNRYVRDFFADNKGRTLKEAIICWRSKRDLPGHNRYERTDLSALDQLPSGDRDIL